MIFKTAQRFTAKEIRDKSPVWQQFINNQDRLIYKMKLQQSRVK